MILGNLLFIYLAAVLTYQLDKAGHHAKQYLIKIRNRLVGSKEYGGLITLVDKIVGLINYMMHAGQTWLIALIVIATAWPIGLEYTGGCFNCVDNSVLLSLKFLVYVIISLALYSFSFNVMFNLGALKFKKRPFFLADTGFDGKMKKIFRNGRNYHLFLLAVVIGGIAGWQYLVGW